MANEGQLPCGETIVFASARPLAYGEISPYGNCLVSEKFIADLKMYLKIVPERLLKNQAIRKL